MENVIFTSAPLDTLSQVLSSLSYDKAFVITDSNVVKLLPEPFSFDYYVIKAGEENKNINQVIDIWTWLHNSGATRNSIGINIGGGIVSDLGGFTFAAFKRGMRFINLPTTLLAAVDASVGGKTGVNFHGIKNEIGAFSSPEKVIISDSWFKTLPHSELLSGYGEMLKHALLTSEMSFYNLLSDINPTQDLIKESIAYKNKIVTTDPKESGLRKVLNLGHTFGHALEELSLSQNPHIPHGIAVAYGLMMTMVLSHIKLGFDSAHLYRYAEFLKDRYLSVIPLKIGCDDYETLYSLMLHDKKNTNAEDINFTLLEKIGQPVINQIAEKDEIFSALDISRDLLVTI